MSTILLDLPSITGAFMVAHAIGDIITGDVVEPEVVVNSLTGSIGISSISSRAKPVAAPVASSTPSGIAATGTVTSDAHKTDSRPLDKDALRIFISSSMPFDLPPADLKQPAWKPYQYKGRQRILFSDCPDVSFPLIGLNADHIEVLSFLPCAQVPEQGVDKQAVMFSPPLGNFVLMRYQAVCGLDHPYKDFTSCLWSLKTKVISYSNCD
ncbi:unnamed protein product [Malus baccata var. baccata]